LLFAQENAELAEGAEKIKDRRRTTEAQRHREGHREENAELAEGAEAAEKRRRRGGGRQEERRGAEAQRRKGLAVGGVRRRGFC
jgi:hypothetical protein